MNKRYAPPVADFYQSHTAKVHTRPRCGNNTAVGFSGMTLTQAAQLVGRKPNLACKRCDVVGKIAEMTGNAAEMLADTRSGEATFAEIFGSTDDGWINGERDFAEEEANAALLREE